MVILSLILGLLAGGLVGGAMVLLDKIDFYLIVVVPVFGGAIIGFAIALPYLGRKARAVSSGLGTGLSASVIADNRPSRLPLIIVALLCEGHVLLEDVPGVGKTTLARSIAR